MDQKEMLKQMLVFNQTTFNNAFNALMVVQQQFEQVAKTAMDQADWLPEDGQEAMNQWAESFKTSRDNFKQYVDESYQKVEKYISQ